MTVKIKSQKRIRDLLNGNTFYAFPYDQKFPSVDMFMKIPPVFQQSSGWSANAVRIRDGKLYHFAHDLEVKECTGWWGHFEKDRRVR